MRRPLVFVGLVLLIVATSAGARERKPKPGSAPTPTRVGGPPMAPPLFDGRLPVELGPLPDGLASFSAQGCHACHDVPYDAWKRSPHAAGPSPALLQAAAESGGKSACLSCHLPLAPQQAARLLSVTPEGAAGRWDATLASEGVTCAACHLRRGAVIGPTPHADAPHTTGWRDDLSAPETCASCHQLTWPGAATPLYDTFGEWSRSPWARVGVTCTTCHMATQGHAMAADRARALSVLVDLDAAHLVRGGSPVQARITLQNTGAGHHAPTGSPWIGWRIEVLLVPESGAARVVTTHDLVRTVAAVAPWQTEKDTRLAAAETRALQASLTLPQEAAPGRWSMVVQVRELVSGAPGEVVAELQRIPLQAQ
jgi:hypothetical protein